jgi:hypothetical protein
MSTFVNIYGYVVGQIHRTHLINIKTVEAG